MKQIEITTRVLENIDKVKEKLLKLGYQQLEAGYIDDTYFCPSLFGLRENNIADFLKRCVLVRCIRAGEDVFQKLTYKNKVFQEDVTLTEEKINVNIDDVQQAKLLLLALHFQELVQVKYDYWVYEKDGVELALQNVEGLGLLLEYEHLEDFAGKDGTTILQAKERMLQDIKNLGIKITDEYDVKKAYELITKKIGTGASF